MSRFIARHRSELAAYFPEGTKVFFAIGRNHRIVPERTIAVGSCSECIRVKTALYVPGCVPAEENVSEAIRSAWKEFERLKNVSKRTIPLFDGPS